METTPQGGAPQKWPSAMSRKIQVLGFVVAPNNRGIQGNQLSTAIAHGKSMELKSDKWRIFSPALLRTKLKMKGISSPSCGESPCGATVFCEFELLLLVNEQTNLTTPSIFCGFRSMFRGPGIRSSAFSWSPTYSPEFLNFKRAAQGDFLRNRASQQQKKPIAIPTNRTVGSQITSHGSAKSQGEITGLNPRLTSHYWAKS